MSCDEIDELLAAYSLGALTAEETAGVDGHLAACRRHDAELAGLRAVVARLPLAADERDVPPGLRARLLASLDEPVPRQERVLPFPRRFAPAPAGFLAAAAVLVLAVIGLLAWNITLQTGRDGDGPMVAQLHGDVGRGSLVYFADEQLGVLRLELPPLPPDSVYQAWGIHESGPASLGLVPEDGSVAFEADLSDASAVAISVEPQGGSEQPTTEPLLIAELS
jgi:anti-sigma-K factor RskA